MTNTKQILLNFYLIKTTHLAICQYLIINRNRNEYINNIEPFFNSSSMNNMTKYNVIHYYYNILLHHILYKEKERKINIKCSLLHIIIYNRLYLIIFIIYKF